MQTLARSLIVVAMVSLFVGGASALAQDQSQSTAPTIAQGQLVRVDANAKTLIIQSAGSQMLFRYTDQTKVSGAQEGVAGLATMAGAQVTVRFVKQQQDNVATEISVQPPAEGQKK
jgi:hypothetical protein